MTATDDDVTLDPDKVRQVIALAWSGLAPDDQLARIQYDQARGIRGCTMERHGNEVQFTRGGRTLAVASLDVLTGDEPLPPGQFMPEAPDDIAELDDDNTIGGDDE